MSFKEPPLSMIEKASILASWSAYAPDVREKAYWHPVIYQYQGSRFKRKSIATPEEANFEKFGRFYLLFSKGDEFVGMSGLDGLELMSAVSNVGQLLRVGDVLLNGTPVTSLRIEGKEIYVNGDSFTDLRNKFFNMQK